MKTPYRPRQQVIPPVDVLYIPPTKKDHRKTLGSPHKGKLEPYHYLYMQGTFAFSLEASPVDLYLPLAIMTFSKKTRPTSLSLGTLQIQSQNRTDNNLRGTIYYCRKHVDSSEFRLYFRKFKVTPIPMAWTYEGSFNTSRTFVGGVPITMPFLFDRLVEGVEGRRETTSTETLARAHVRNILHVRGSPSPTNTKNMKSENYPIDQNKSWRLNSNQL